MNLATLTDSRLLQMTEYSNHSEKLHFEEHSILQSEKHFCICCLFIQSDTNINHPPLCLAEILFFLLSSADKQANQVPGVLEVTTKNCKLKLSTYENQKKKKKQQKTEASVSILITSMSILGPVVWSLTRVPSSQIISSWPASILVHGDPVRIYFFCFILLGLEF